MVKWHIFLLAFFIGGITYQDNPPSASTCIAPPAENLQLDTSAGYADAIQNYLSAGGDPAQLKSLLQPLGVIPDTTKTDGVYVTDLTGDGKDDVIVNIAFPAKPPAINTFVVWIYVCDETGYHRVNDHSYTQTSTALDPGMYVDSIQDLNHDSHPEVIYQFVGCGMYCFMDLYIVGWNSSTRQIHQMLWTSFQVGDYNFTDPDGDGIYDIIVTENNGGAAGLGPLRRWQTTYGWDGVNFTQRRSVSETPRFGFEAAQDAANALHIGDLQTAAILYQKILDNHTFNDIDERTDAITKSQALFGLLVIRTFQQDHETAAAIYAALQDTQGIPDDYYSTINTHYSESIWTQVGRTFYSRVRGYNLSDACNAVITELTADLERKDKGSRSTYWGNYGLRPRPEDICPF
ncbi:MAG: hypothetical protein ABI690_21760 [Chloroflexota bacterium]